MSVKVNGSAISSRARRIGAAMLCRIAVVLDVKPASFFAGAVTAAARHEGRAYGGDTLRGIRAFCC